LIRQILIKDWKLLWSMVCLTVAVQLGRVWAGAGSDLLHVSLAGNALLRPLTIAWFIAISALTVAVVHQDPIPGVNQDWLIRPLRRTQLLLAKLSFLAITISGPMLLLDLLAGLAAGMPPARLLAASIAQDAFVYFCMVVPVAALASTTRNMTEIIIFGAILFLAFSASLSFSALLLGADWCPTCGSGMAWLQHLVQHLIVLLGAIVVLLLQYYRRRSTLARAIALIGAVSLVFLQLPWSSAFAVERWLTGSKEGAARIALDLDAAELQSSPDARGGQPASSARGGRMGRVIDYLRHRGRDDQVTIELPVLVSGLDENQLLLVDRSEFRVLGADARLLHRHTSAGWTGGLSMDGDDDAIKAGLAHQLVDIPAGVAQAGVGSRLQIDYAMTLLEVRASHRIAATGGSLRSPDVGRCATQVRRNTLALNCRAIGAAPFCYAAALYSADGRVAAEAIRCNADYRRHWPTLIDVESPYGLELPLRDAAASDMGEMTDSYVLLRIYAERDHFQRTLLAPLPAPHWRASAGNSPP
jgi:hypothetical protein